VNQFLGLSLTLEIGNILIGINVSSDDLISGSSASLILFRYNSSR